MRRRLCESTISKAGLIRPPAYPFDARVLFRELRFRLSAEHGESIGYERLGQLIGKPKSTAYHWFDLFDHPHVLAFMCLIERLSPEQRQVFIESHCRALPSLEHPSIGHAPGKVGMLSELLLQTRGLTLIVGGADTMRTFLVTALAHTYRRIRMKAKDPLGIDLHRPFDFVPAESLTYCAPGDALGAKELTERLLPRLLTSKERLLIFNGVWSTLPEVRHDLLRCCGRNHVVLVEAGFPNLRALQSTVSAPLTLVTVSAAKRIAGGMLINCRHLRKRKRP